MKQYYIISLTRTVRTALQFTFWSKNGGYTIFIEDAKIINEKDLEENILDLESWDLEIEKELIDLIKQKMIVQIKEDNALRYLVENNKNNRNLLKIKLNSLSPDYSGYDVYI